MKEIKEKLILALKEIDLGNLTIMDLHTYASIASIVENLDKKDFSEILKEQMQNSSGLFGCSTYQPKTISDLKGV